MAVFWGNVKWEGNKRAAGLVLGSLLALRLHPIYPLRVAMLGAMLMGLPLLALGARLPLEAVVVSSLVQGAAISVFGILWETTLQTQIPRAILGRVAAFDWLGSLAFVPIAQVVVGIFASRFETTALLITEWALVVGVGAAALAAPSVRGLRRADS